MTPKQNSDDQLRRRLPLSIPVFQILLSLHRAPLHGYSIIQDIAERTEGDVRLTASTLYDALARLVDQGVIEEVGAPKDAIDQDARRRYYQLTTSGRQLAKMEAERLERLVRLARQAGTLKRGAPR